MEEKFYKVDLHIHTPSSECYRGKKNDEEYFRILEKALEMKIDVISITDHNSIEGYKKLQLLKENLIRTKEKYNLITDSEQAKKEIIIIDRKLRLFENLLIIPGVEFEVRNAVHFLVLFNPSTKIKTIEKFIEDGGYSSDEFGVEDVLKMPNWDILDLYEESKKYDCLVVDAHSDSNKGILNTIAKGRLRAAAFRSDQLTGICYSSEKQKDKLIETLKNSDEYKRKTPLAFFKFSDAHHVDEIGSNITWIRLDEKNFESIKISISNPSENVSVVKPRINKILDNLIENENSFGVTDLSEANKGTFKKYVCALNNSNGGYILLGLTPEKNKIGLHLKDKKEFDSTIATLRNCLSEFELLGYSKINIYPLQNRKIVVTVYITQSDTLVSLKNDNLIYSLRNKKLIVLSANEVQSIVEKRCSEKMEQKILKRISVVETQCNQIKSAFLSLPLIRSFENSSLSLSSLLGVEILESIKIKQEKMEKIKKWSPNGYTRGNLFYISESQTPRLTYSYLRYSIPTFYLKNCISKSKTEGIIYLVPGGGSYYSKKELPVLSLNDLRVLKLIPRISNHYSTKLIATFLKSSFLMWYSYQKYDSIDYFLPKIYNELRFPRLYLKNHKTCNYINLLENTFDNIIKIEKNFLVELNKNQIEGEDGYNFIMSHNQNIDNLAYKLDMLINKLIGLSVEEIEIIENFLKAQDIYLPEVQNRKIYDHIENEIQT